MQHRHYPQGQRQPERQPQPQPRRMTDEESRDATARDFAVGVLDEVDAMLQKFVDRGQLLDDSGLIRRVRQARAALQ